MPAIVKSVPREASGICLQNTFKTSLCTLRLFPTARRFYRQIPDASGKVLVAHVAMAVTEVSVSPFQDNQLSGTVA
jgi:hypothetical protein